MLATAFPDALAVVALEPEDRLGLELAATEGTGLGGTSQSELMIAAMRAYESGAAFAIEDETHLRDELPDLHAAVHGARAVAPLRAPDDRERAGDRRSLPGLRRRARALDEHERAHVAWYAEETALALDRARSFEHEHTVAVSLQRSLLSQDLPAIDGLELARPLPGGQRRDGGRRRLVRRRCRRSDGIVHITVGDVAGRGIPAAVLMGQMRNAFRAYAYDHTSPAELLRRMRRHITGDEMATAVCLTLDPYTRELTYASAGHPPSLLVGGAGGAVTPPRRRRRAAARLRRGRDDPRGRRRARRLLHARRLHRRADRAPRLEHRRRHRHARGRARSVRAPRRRGARRGASPTRSRHASTPATTSRS